MKDIARLIKGFRRFREGCFSGDAEIFGRLSEGQSPRVLVVGCSDSRVDPAMLTGSGPGELFVVRNVANLVPPYEPGAGYHGVSSALEYAVTVLGVEHVIVLGHSGCGGINALYEGAASGPAGEFIGRWVEIAASARDAIVSELKDKPAELKLRALEQAAILVSLDNLLTFPWIARRVESGALHLHGWYFDMRGGGLASYNPASGSFEALVPGGPAGGAAG